MKTQKKIEIKDNGYKYQFVNDKRRYLSKWLNNFLADPKIKNYEYIGTEKRSNVRNELQGQPKFRNLCGPLWNGYNDNVPVIRYETIPFYNNMSID